ncbi:hypothetical protein AGLY_008184 [Aphis glycines]|uniref:Uncharacterized protein n=1 Tax=Aphis glycines TaxID=307491 RepID=A0A6G0TL40_APHGL|nr:hypothetical protein AGLY_008184 [Aphis glycines]
MFLIFVFQKKHTRFEIIMIKLHCELFKFLKINGYYQDKNVSYLLIFITIAADLQHTPSKRIPGVQFLYNYCGRLSMDCTERELSGETISVMVKDCCLGRRIGCTQIYVHIFHTDTSVQHRTRILCAASSVPTVYSYDRNLLGKKSALGHLLRRLSVSSVLHKCSRPVVLVPQKLCMDMAENKKQNKTQFVNLGSNIREVSLKDDLSYYRKT